MAFSAAPNSSRISIERVNIPIARVVIVGPESWSMTRHGTPKRYSSQASVNPVGPAPTTTIPGSALVTGPARSVVDYPLLASDRLGGPGLLRLDLVGDPRHHARD